MVTAVGASAAITTITASLGGVTSPAVTITITATSSVSWNTLNIARYDHTATLLNDGTGRVLVAGGYGNGPAGSTLALASAELYDPSLNKWTLAGNMGTARRDHTATLLANGQIVQIGGGGDATLNDLDSAEVYTPNLGIGTWSSYASILNIPRAYHTATLLTNGKILVVGGGGLDPRNELYDPANPTVKAVLTATDTSSTGRYSHTATLLPDGRVLVVGGFANSATVLGAGSVLDTAELCDPTGTTMTLTATSPKTGRYLHSATLLGNGKVLVAGGRNAAQVETNSAELYDPATNTWSQTGSLAIARSEHIATLMPNGQVLVVGGVNGNSTLSSAELYDPVAGTWSSAANLQYGRAVFSATLLPHSTLPTSDQVLVVGGDGAAGILSNVELHN